MGHTRYGTEAEEFDGAEVPNGYRASLKSVKSATSRFSRKSLVSPVVPMFDDAAGETWNMDVASCRSMMREDSDHYLTSDEEDVPGADNPLCASLKAMDAPPEPARTEVVDELLCAQNKRIRELWTSPDWHAVWIGSFNFLLVALLSFFYPYAENDNARDWLLPRPKRWSGNPLDAFSLYNGVGLVVVFTSMLVPFCLSQYVLGKFTPSMIPSFTICFFLALFSFFLGSHEGLRDFGIGYAVIAIASGLIIANVVSLVVDVSYLNPMAASGEFFIKCSLVLMAVELRTIESYGPPGILVGWVTSPISIAFTYLFTHRVLKCENKHLCMLLGVGVSWCGASAITAVAPVIKAKPADVSVSIGLVCLFVIAWTFILPYFALAVGMDDNVAGAWLGGSVDQTANVVVAAAIVSEECKEVAATVKMILNAGLGAMCVAISIIWIMFIEKDPGQKMPTAMTLWDKFPKFVLGFLVLSLVLSLIISKSNDEYRSDCFAASVMESSNWWAAMGFIGIGINTNVKALMSKVQRGPVIGGYFVGGIFDILITWIAAYVFFSGLTFSTISNPPNER
ncbi:UPF0324 membrane protein [Diplonema papillatum]|nr:UPF0324 membrane protein [Diplonema papillatum]